MKSLDLDSLYTSENPIQKINPTAAKIEAETGIGVVRAHLGNPTAPQLESTNMLVGDYYQHRPESPRSSGYEDVGGNPGWLHLIAKALTVINRLPTESIDYDNLIGVPGGTGALNIAFHINKDATILVSDPYYPPWMDIAEHTGVDKIETFPLLRKDSFLLNEDIITKRVEEINEQNSRAGFPDKKIVLIYHYPHNPTGKTLSEQEAKDVAKVLNNLCKKFPNLELIQEDLYLATTASDKGIYTPLPHLDENAKSRTMWIHSPSKMGHAQDRGAVIGAFNKNYITRARGCSSFSTLGNNHPALLATANTLMEIADGGVEARGKPGTRPDNYRYKIADYYQERLKIVADGIKDIIDGIEKVNPDLAKEILPEGVPGGAYYLFPNFEFLKGKAIPDQLKPIFGDKKAFENADDINLALQNAHLLGLQPVTIASGTLFRDNQGTMEFRFSAIERDTTFLEGAVNTLKGLTEKVMNIKSGAHFFELEELRKYFPVVTRSQKELPLLPDEKIKQFQFANNGNFKLSLGKVS